MCAHPGKKLFFMGSEFGQWTEWRNDEQISWGLLEQASHRGLQSCVRELNHLTLEHPQFHGSDCDQRGFVWLDASSADDSVLAFQRRVTDESGAAPILCVFNATPVPRPGYCVRVPDTGPYHKIFDSDAQRFGGSGYNGQQSAHADGALLLDLPPLGAMFLVGSR
jgi:1,4-alpha-glucan branching enzyme